MSIVGRCDIQLGRARVKPDSAVLFGLLLYLSLRAGTPVTRQELLDLLWPDGHDRSRRHALRQLLYRVRRAGVTLDVHGDEMTVARSSVRCDLLAVFDPDWPARARVADIPSPRAILPGYRPTLGAAFDTWLESLRDDAAGRIRLACQRHIGTGRHEGRWEDVENVARICLQCDPLNEDATLALAEATAMAGAQAESLRILDTYLWEIGGHSEGAGNEARLLRRRIAAQPHFHLQRSGEPPLIGRAEDLVWLNARRDAVGPTSPATAMLAGPPGIGKTAIVRAFTAYAEMRGWQVAVSRLQPTDGDRPMSVFLELLPRLLAAGGALGAAPESIAQLRRLLGVRNEGEELLAGLSQEPEAVQARIRMAALDLLGAVAHEGPLIVVLEDLHWIDMPSLRLLAWCVERAERLPILWLMTSRMESRFAVLRESFPADRVPTRTIGPLGPAESAELFNAFAPGARRHAEMAQMAFTATGGNPLFIREVAGHWSVTGQEQLPVSLRSLMQERVARLTVASQRVLHCCAVLGRFATVPRVAAVLEVGTVELLEAVEELDGLGLVGIDGTPGSLALHDLWQEQVVASTKPSARALLELRSGEVLEKESQIDHSAALAADAARHLIAGGARARAIRLLCHATEHQLANGLTDDAVTTSRHGWNIAHEPADKSRCTALYLRALHQAGRWADILTVGPTIAQSTVSDVAIPHDDAELFAIEALWRTGRSPHFAAERALSCGVEASAPALHRIRACLIAAQTASNLFDAKVLAKAYSLAVDIVRSSPETMPVGQLVDIIYETELGSLTAAVTLASELVEQRRRDGRPEELTRALRFACYPCRSAGDLDRALALSTEAHRIAAQHQLAEQAAHSADICATIELDRRHFETAEAWLDKSEAWAQRISLTYLRRSQGFLRAHLALSRSDHDAAAQLIEELAAGGPATTAREALESMSLQCRIHAIAGRLDQLRESATRLGVALERSRCFFRQDPYVSAYVMALTVLGDRAAAGEYARRYRDEWRRDQSPLPVDIAALASI
ncbi:MAG TPA: AAA family ATPase [Gammaproteobacteria bacterium]|nr:AAA family ATPase [Gammaproteobacteria bacterium]